MGRKKGGHNKSKNTMDTQINNIPNQNIIQAVSANPVPTANLPEPAQRIVATEEKVQFTCIPPVELKRNKYGLLENINYTFDSQGFIQWRALLKNEHLVLNKQKKDELEKIYKKPLAEIDIAKDGVEDKYILILLSGIRYLAQIYGFKKITYNYGIDAGRAHAKCQIEWIQNFENNYVNVVTESIAERSIETTVFPFSSHLVSLAENAAFSRTVRNFLRINILAEYEVTGMKNEVPGQEESENPISPPTVLKNYLASHKTDFAKLKVLLIDKIDDKGQRIFPDAENWNKETDIKSNIILTIIGMLQEKNDKKK